MVDDAVLRIERTYDDMGRLQTLTSYDAATAGNIVNQDTWTYDGNVIATAQSRSGAVDSSTPTVQYTYDDGAVDGEAHHVRLTQVTYPGGRKPTGQ